MKVGDRVRIARGEHEGREGIIVNPPAQPTEREGAFLVLKVPIGCLAVQLEATGDRPGRLEVFSDSLLLVQPRVYEMGQPIDPAKLSADERIEYGLARLSADMQPSTGWQDRVVAKASTTDEENCALFGGRPPRPVDPLLVAAKEGRLGYMGGLPPTRTPRRVTLAEYTAELEDVLRHEGNVAVRVGVIVRRLSDAVQLAAELANDEASQARVRALLTIEVP